MSIFATKNFACDVFGGSYEFLTSRNSSSIVRKNCWYQVTDFFLICMGTNRLF